MPTFDERFARQYRCRPPPEFPLASPDASIVRTLSGLSGRARIAAPAEARTGLDGGRFEAPWSK